MKLTQVSIQNGRGETLNLPLHSYANGFLVKDITGLDPVGASLVSTTVAKLDGAQFQASRREVRNVVLTLGLEPDYTIHDDVGMLRRILYNYAMPETEVTLRFDMDDVFYASLVVRVEKLETSMFTASPEVQISFIGYDPDFVGEELRFEPILSGETIEYRGTVPAGVELFYTPPEGVTDPWIEISNPSGTPRRLTLRGAFDEANLHINTNPGKKHVTDLEAPQGQNSLLYAVSRTTSWPFLETGSNTVTFSQGIGSRLGVITNNKYGGL